MTALRHDELGKGLKLFRGTELLYARTTHGVVIGAWTSHVNHLALQLVPRCFYSCMGFTLTLTSLHTIVYKMFLRF